MVPFLLALAVSGSDQTSSSPSAQIKGTAVPVKVIRQGEKFLLERGGKPYFVQGVGGMADLDGLRRIGGNSFRTWGADRLADELEEARKRDLTVCAGIWLGHKRHGFRYDDEKMVKEQFDRTLEIVRKHKDHPNLLVWGLGNEVELDGDDPKAWKAINDLAKAVKAIDPNHPVMTVVAEVHPQKAERIKTMLPDVDILGVNSYGGLSSLPKRYAEFAVGKPYLVTEYGPLGQWEVGKTSWGAPIEQTSTEKANLYAKNHADSIRLAPSCLGGYAFLWGNKQEATATWFGMRLASGESLGSVDALAKEWGKPKANRAPLIAKLESGFANGKVKPDSVLEAKVEATDPDGDKLVYRWVVQAEQTEPGSGGDAEKVPPVYPDQLLAPFDQPTVRFKAPTKPGGYRLFVYITDGKGNAATGNHTFFVEP